jgi:hypothetical protein
MRIPTTVRSSAAALALSVTLAGPALAQAVGTWVQQAPEAGTAAMTMKVEECCNGGLRLIYTIAMPGQQSMQMIVESPMDGSDVPVMVGGQPSGQTMGIRRVDARHSVGVLKMNGQAYQTSRATISADGNTMTVENEVAGAPGQPAQNITQVWVRQ